MPESKTRICVLGKGDLSASKTGVMAAGKTALVPELAQLVWAVDKTFSTQKTPLPSAASTVLP